MAHASFDRRAHRVASCFSALLLAVIASACAAPRERCTAGTTRACTCLSGPSTETCNAEGSFVGCCGPDAVCDRMQSPPNACADCCASNHPEGEKTYSDAVVACMCGATGGCADSCAEEYCDTPTRALTAQGDACDTCWHHAWAACSAIVNDTCDADSDCTAWVACATPCR